MEKRQYGVFVRKKSSKNDLKKRREKEGSRWEEYSENQKA